jgi:hypothetical protein
MRSELVPVVVLPAGSLFLRDTWDVLWPSSRLGVVGPTVLAEDTVVAVVPVLLRLVTEEWAECPMRDRDRLEWDDRCIGPPLSETGSSDDLV